MMKHPIQSVHRRTYNVIHRIFFRGPLKLKHQQSLVLWRRVLVTATILFVVLHILFQLDFAFVVFMPDSYKTDASAEVCIEAKRLETQHDDIQDKLKSQIKLQTRLLHEEYVVDEVDEILLPETKKVLDEGRAICPFYPPDLVGSLEVNTETSSLDVDLKRLDDSLKQHYKGFPIYHTNRRRRSLINYFDGLQFQTINALDKRRLRKNHLVQRGKYVYKLDSTMEDQNVSEIHLPVSTKRPPMGIVFPKHCIPHRKTAIVIPYRNRLDHLMLFVRHMHSILQRQEIEYGIYVINLAGDALFNRAKLLNIGFKEVMKHFPGYDCIIFHDVDLLPEDDRNLYTCSSEPKHMSAAINIFHYKIPYQQIFGGVTAMTPEQFRLVNGYSNEYWGWGGEDDDMFRRIFRMCMSVYRISSNVARYHMAKHTHDKGNEVLPERFNILKGADNRQSWDGLSSLEYQVLNRQYNFLYNNITVLIGSPNGLNMKTLGIWKHLLIFGICVTIIYVLLLKDAFIQESKT
ncbi:uncharacterized protein LOC143465946 [Clavelina lepadiformis]|uniref:Beta-1,4-N-acetylgalactosaminyltransferase bre-4 n=1 Tax=Clavelina lepadiformis TaxID=159417 RepID=A0ABP0F1M6_CLALP